MILKNIGGYANYHTVTTPKDIRGDSASLESLSVKIRQGCLRKSSLKKIKSQESDISLICPEVPVSGFCQIWSVISSYI